MADVTEGTEGTETTTNGASQSSFADARAAFLAGEDLEKPAPKTGKAGREVADDDSDLDDEDDSELEDESETEDRADEEDPDADLDEDDDDEETAKDDDDDEKPDADTAKRLSQVQRTEKRMREQLKKERAQMEAEVQRQVQDAEARLDAEVKKWQPRIEAAEKFEKLAARANIDPVAVVKALGVTKDRYEYIGQVFYTLAKAEAGDEKAKLAAAQLVKQSEYDAEIADLKKWREDREKTELEREQQAEAERKVDAFIGKVEKAVSDKTPLAKTLLKNDPEGAREELQIVTHKLAKEIGGWPEPKAVMIAFEKRQRAKLRKLGIDPKAKGAAAALAETTDSKTTTTSKKSDKKAAKPTEKSGGEKLSPRDAFIRGDKFD